MLSPLLPRRLSLLFCRKQRCQERVRNEHCCRLLQSILKTLLELIKILQGKVAGDVASQLMLLGAVISFVIGVLGLRWLIRLLAADCLHWFAIDFLIVGNLTIAWQSG